MCASSASCLRVNLDGVVIQLSRCLSGLVVIIMIGYGQIFFFCTRRQSTEKVKFIQMNQPHILVKMQAGSLIQFTSFMSGS